MKNPKLEEKLIESFADERLRKHFANLLALSTPEEQQAYWEQIKVDLANEPAEVQAEFFRAISESRELLKKSTDELYEKILARKNPNAA